MQSPKYHVFICANRRPPGHPKGSCFDRGAPDIHAKFVEEVGKLNLWGTVEVTTSGCLGPCLDGPTVVVYPEGVWYGKITPNDVAEIVESHFVNGQPVQRCRL